MIGLRTRRPCASARVCLKKERKIQELKKDAKNLLTTAGPVRDCSLSRSFCNRFTQADSLPIGGAMSALTNWHQANPMHGKNRSPSAIFAISRTRLLIPRAGSRWGLCFGVHLGIGPRIRGSGPRCSTGRQIANALTEGELVSAVIHRLHRLWGRTVLTQRGQCARSPNASPPEMPTAGATASPAYGEPNRRFFGRSFF